MIEWSNKYSNGAWVVDDYATAKVILSSSSFSVQRGGRWINTSAKKIVNEDLGPFKLLLKQSVVFLDGEKHRKIRSLLIRKIRDAVSDGFIDEVDHIVDETFRQIKKNIEFNFIDSIARVIPAKSVACLMGIHANNEDLYHWSDAIADFLGAPVESGKLAIEAQNAVLEMTQYFNLEYVRKKYLDDDSGLLSSISAEITSDWVRGRQVLLAQLCTLLFGGYETTRNLIGNAVYLLMTNQDQLDMIRKNPELIDNCIAEVLRFESPVQYTGRLVKKEIKISGIEMQIGDLVIVDIGASNRDPLIYENPNVFNIQRKIIPHISFGFGSHFCLGSHLSFIECRAVLRKILESNLDVSNPMIWSKNNLYRGLSSLPTTFQ